MFQSRKKREWRCNILFINKNYKDKKKIKSKVNTPRYKKFWQPLQSNKSKQHKIKTTKNKTI